MGRDFATPAFRSDRSPTPRATGSAPPTTAAAGTPGTSWATLGKWSLSGVREDAVRAPWRADEFRYTAGVFGGGVGVGYPVRPKAFASMAAI